MESYEDFFIEIAFDGDQYWRTMAQIVSGYHFGNNKLYENIIVNYDVPGGSRNGLLVRFRCDASSDYDMVLVDDIGIYGK
jgi:hypothetical protein